MYFIILLENITFQDALLTKSVAGYYLKEEDAIKALIKNSRYLWETCYNYAVIEQIEEGINHDIGKERWFKFTRLSQEYYEIERPAELGGWQIGIR